MTFILQWTALMAVFIGIYVVGRIADKRESKSRSR